MSKYLKYWPETTEDLQPKRTLTTQVVEALKVLDLSPLGVLHSTDDENDSYVLEVRGLTPTMKLDLDRVAKFLEQRIPRTTIKPIKDAFYADAFLVLIDEEENND